MLHKKDLFLYEIKRLPNEFVIQKAKYTQNKNNLVKKKLTVPLTMLRKL